MKNNQWNEQTTYIYYPFIFLNGPLACQAYQAEVENAVIRTLAVTPNWIGFIR